MREVGFSRSVGNDLLLSFRLWRILEDGAFNTRDRDSVWEREVLSIISKEASIFLDNSEGLMNIDDVCDMAPNNEIKTYLSVRHSLGSKRIESNDICHYNKQAVKKL